MVRAEMEHVLNENLVEDGTLGRFGIGDDLTGALQDGDGHVVDRAQRTERARQARCAGYAGVARILRARRTELAAVQA